MFQILPSSPTRSVHWCRLQWPSCIPAHSIYFRYWLQIYHEKSCKDKKYTKIYYQNLLLDCRSITKNYTKNLLSKLISKNLKNKKYAKNLYQLKFYIKNINYSYHYIWLVQLFISLYSISTIIHINFGEQYCDIV